MRAGHGGPLFVCHANCCRSVLACYLYRHLCNKAPALSAGLEVGERINDRAERMLREWGIDASAHRPLKLSRNLCAEATAIFVMGPSYLHSDASGCLLLRKTHRDPLLNQPVGPAVGLGPAPWRPYHSSYVRGGWRNFYDFHGGGILEW